jgi:hypothetical protein
MKKQSIVNFFASVWSIIKKIWKWLTISHIWMVITWTINIIGILFLLWIVLSAFYAFITLLGAFFATTSFSDDNSLANLASRLFNLPKMEMLAVIALVISGVNSVIKYVKIYNLEVENSELDAENFDLKVTVSEKQLEIDALKEEIEFRDNKEINHKIDSMSVSK